MANLFFLLLLLQGYVIASDNDQSDNWMDTWIYIADEYKEPRSVSLIYFPTTRGARGPSVGHVELEVNGDSWNLAGEAHYGSRPLSTLISKATSGGLPFFRYIFDADSYDIEEIKKHIYKSRWSISCCSAALYPLHQADVCFMPFPCNISPLLTALYLKTGKEFHLNSVKNIEYYGNASLSKSVFKMLPGVAMELIVTCMMVALVKESNDIN